MKQTRARFVDRIDCHVHSRYSPDGRGTVEELAKVAMDKGLTGICITDHNSLRIAADAKEARFENFIVLSGMEVSTKQGHCLALGVREEVPRMLSLPETLEKITAAGGVGVPSHPFRRIHGVGELGVLQAKPKAIEVFNARDGHGRSHKAARLAEENRFGGTGGSDAHQIFETGNAYAVFKEPVNDVDDFLDQLEEGTTWGKGEPTPKRQIFMQNFKNVWLWARRGFRSI
ncbi:MAG: PHP domain-containing protein [Euryarchaeota archaeon]|nr:PHP domain-containing protein [Euryarchaeota archaeon]